MVLAWEAYKCPKSVILFVIEDVTYNICDQRFHEFEIRRQRPELHVIRRNLTQISQTGQLTDDKRLIIDGDEVAVVYFRAGYEPGHYHSEAEWEARLTIERSRAIKSPSIQCHLAGTKKVQQEIARPGILKKFLPDSEAELVSNLFTGLYTLDLVLEKMKDSSEREAYILMDRIRPPVQHNYLVRPHESVKLVEDKSDKEITINTYSGHMLRTKPSSVNEGGVAAGLGALDSVFLFD
ncbi:Glutathione synthetase-like 1 [Homarus americanus]|uniref:Glutathione synthetase n=1 Tax=Homarus americanus TaxID=6706 RepID=A0A8J5MR08_HOMAM|nr:Glutathione synthetase-like 1 [Homarus americanus]